MNDTFLLPDDGVLCEQVAPHYQAPAIPSALSPTI